MQRYHDTRNDPLPLTSTVQETERLRIEQATQAFLARGGEIEQVGYQMSEAPASFVINPERTPVYAHLFQPPAAEPVRQPEPEIEPEPAAVAPAPADADDLEVKQAALVMAAAALGDAPKWIAKKLHMTEKRVRQLARDYHISFRAQR
ncbi:hypothetical protein [Pseudomonas sp.]|uniref:hypothetical protein n=1 Tax=Pseudomonas sp. TaxID=306 RepID=UPI00261B21AB|nr:hypothetical protein [Pseudomonas sp.]